MKISILRPLLALLASTLVLAGIARADTITLIDGKTIENVTIVTETLKELTYKQDGKPKTVPSDTVVAVEFKKKPKLVDQADTMARDGDILGAMDTLATYVGGITEGSGRETLAWAPAYAMQRLIDLAASLGDDVGVIEHADRLIKSAPDSRYLPGAHLQKALALAEGKKHKEALAAIAEMRQLVDAHNLGQRWKLEADLAQAMLDPALVGTKRRARVVEIAGLAGKDFPTVANRARVVEGESYLEGEQKDFVKAKAVFEQIVADPKADKATLAGAYTGLGDCLFSQAIDTQTAGKEAGAGFLDAVQAYMRVVVLYPEQVRHRAKSMFLAGRAFEFIGDDTSKLRARQLYRRVMTEFKESTWAGEAKKQMGG